MKGGITPLIRMSSNSKDRRPQLASPSPQPSVESPSPRGRDKRQLRSRTLQSSRVHTQMHELSPSRNYVEKEASNLSEKMGDSGFDSIRETWEKAERCLASGDLESRNIVLEKLKKLTAMLDEPLRSQESCYPSPESSTQSDGKPSPPPSYSQNYPQYHQGASLPTMPSMRPYPGYYMPMMMPMPYSAAMPMHPYMRQVPYNAPLPRNSSKQFPFSVANGPNFAEESHTKFVVSTGPPIKRRIWRYRSEAKCSRCKSKTVSGPQRSNCRLSLCNQCNHCSPIGSKVAKTSIKE